MATLFVRLSVIFVPLLVVVSAVLGSHSFCRTFVERWWGWRPSPGVWRSGICIVLATSAVSGIADLQHMLGQQSESLFPEKMALMKWIQANTLQDAAFASDMPLTSVVKAVTGRRIVNHPHYEDASMRARTYNVYKIYSRLPDLEVRRALELYRTNYVILDDGACGDEHAYPKCKSWEVQDAELPELKNSRAPFCKRWLSATDGHTAAGFKKVYSSKGFAVLKVVQVEQADSEGGDVF